MSLPVQYEEALKDRRFISQFSHGRYDKDMKLAAERQFALQILQRNDQLQRCSPESVALSLLDASYSGLSLSPSLAHAYLIPYGDQCTFAPGYRGLLHLAYRARTVQSVQSNLVYEKDPVFKVWTDEHGRHIEHQESRSDRGGITHSYVIANIAAGGPPIIETMNKQQLEAIEKAAKSRPRGGMVWRGPFREEMCRKAVIRRASKFWPKDDGGALEHMMTVSDRHDGIDFPTVEPDQTEVEQEMCLSADQIADIEGMLRDKGISPTVTPEWLRRYAERLGYASIDYVPARFYEQAKQELGDYAQSWTKKTK